MKLLSLATNSSASAGYVSILTLPVVAALLLLLLGSATQQHRLQRQWHLQSAADAMALSAATIMAREFNLLAIVNRAIIANQVTRGQLLGLSSWYSNLATAALRLAVVSSVIPYVNVLTRYLATIMQRIEQPLRAIIQAALVMQQVVETVLHTAQWMIRSSFAMLIPKTLTELAQRQQVAEQSWEIFHSPGLIEFPWLWWRVVTPQLGVQDESLLADMVTASRDPFSQSRSYRWLDGGLVRIQKTGGSELQVEQYGRWGWQALDTVAVHINLLFTRQEIPWGYGATYQTTAINRMTNDAFGRSRRSNPRTTRGAVANQHNYGVALNPQYFNQRELLPTEWPAVIVKFDRVVAKAGLRFSRPPQMPRRDGRIERANLFNPLWEPELQALTTADKLVLERFL